MKQLCCLFFCAFRQTRFAYDGVENSAAQICRFIRSKRKFKVFGSNAGLVQKTDCVGGGKRRVGWCYEHHIMFTYSLDALCTIFADFDLNV